MTDAGGTTTLTQLSNVGPYMVYALKNTSVDSGETIPFDGPSNSPVVAEDKVVILGAENQTTEASLNSSGMTVAYDETNMHFTYTDAGTTDDVVVIVFMYIPKADSTLGD